MMRNIQNTTNHYNGKQTVVLPLSEYKRVEKFLANNLSLSLLDITFEILGVPEKAIKFLKLLVEYSKNIDILENQNFEVTLSYSEIAEQIREKKSIKAKKKDIQIKQNKVLIPANEKKEIKAVIDILEETKKDGATYRLRFFKAVSDSTKEFLGQSSLSLIEISELITFAQKLKSTEVEFSNSKFKDLLKILKKHLTKLPEKMIVERSEQVQKSQSHQESIKRF